MMALKEVNAKEATDMTQEEVIALQDLDDAFYSLKKLQIKHLQKTF